MSLQDEDAGRPRGIFRRVWWALNRPSARYGAGLLVFFGVIVGAASWQGFNTVVSYTNTVEFCVSCHEMESYVFPGYAQSSHYSNTIGVRISCADCHVPEAFFPKMRTKINATLVEVPGHLVGRISTEEKYLEHRPVMAQRVRDRMAATDSRECRSCHSWEAMTMDTQSPRARQQHISALDTGGTCVNCHQGIVHSLPPGLQEEELDFGF